MRIPLRSLLFATAFAVAAAISTHTAAAETLRVPFDFSLHGKTMPAGVYSVHRDGLTDFVSFSGPDGIPMGIWMLVPGDAEPSSKTVKLSFIRNGSQYTLHTIQYHELTTSNIDKINSKGSVVRIISGE